ncbi:DUF4376 domain-containing protein [Paraburkholderia sp. RL18-103-BIB-C]|uniref:DUF4376 domain-containing protein n=1 Tax=Paraburkholderia sp. RL18-103-BIB-C TaxID=3031637 RepID=UPI0038BDF305
MKTYARIDNEQVAELFETDGNMAEMFHPAIVWVDVTLVSPQPVVGWGAAETNAVWSFSAPAAPTAAQLLASAQSAQSAAIDEAYAAAVQQSVTFKTAAGVTETFQADAASQTILMQATQGYQIAGATPTGFYWKAADNTQVAFTLADLQGLYTTILAQGWAAFQKRTTLKEQIAAATTLAAVQAITWSN